MKQGFIPTSKILDFDVIMPNSEVKEALNLKDDEEVYCIKG